jgi:5'-methylthioadenosine phosphorylase
MWAIIGGSGFENFKHIIEQEFLCVETPFGQASSGLRRILFHDTPCIFLPRHGMYHEKTPSEVNYRANIYALKALGVTKVISLSAVGSLQKEYAPGDVVIPSQYIDSTKGIRKATFCGDGLVGHVSLAKPVWQAGVKLIEYLSPQFDFNIHVGKSYVCVEGPYFSTQAESLSYRARGADIIGMTNFPEYGLAREAGIAYLPCCFVTDYDCWDDSIEHVNLNMVIELMKKNNLKAFDLITKIFAHSPEIDAELVTQGLGTNLFSTQHLSEQQHQILAVLKS